MSESLLANERLAHAMTHAGKRADIRKRSAALKARQAGCVIYFIQAGKHVKVGISRRDAIKSRINAIQVGNPYRVKVLRLLHTSHPRADERTFHRVLARYHVRGEWFLIDNTAIMALLTGQSQMP